MNIETHGRRRFLGLQLLALALVVSGCNLLPEPQVDNVRYFTLSGPPGTAVPTGAVRVRPVQVAGHLRNRAMAVRVGENEISYLDDVRWAEPVADALTQSLRTRLAAVTGDSVVQVQVQRFELVRSEGNSVQLAATYTIDSLGQPTRHGIFTASPRIWDGKDYGALVGLLHDAAAELGDTLVAALSEKK